MRVIENPISGERIIIRRGATQTNGDLLRFDLILPPGTHVPARHAHPGQEESFTVISGTMHFRVGRREFAAHRGDIVRVPPGTAHWFGNRSSGTVHARVEARPALRLEEFLAANGSLECRTVAGRTLPRLTALAAVLLEFQQEVKPPLIPKWLYRAVLVAPAGSVAGMSAPGGLRARRNRERDARGCGTTAFTSAIHATRAARD